jgi:hypothetical protein
VFGVEIPGEDPAFVLPVLPSDGLFPAPLRAVFLKEHGELRGQAYGRLPTFDFMHRVAA